MDLISDSRLKGCIIRIKKIPLAGRCHEIGNLAGLQIIEIQNAGIQ